MALVGVELETFVWLAFISGFLNYEANATALYVQQILLSLVVFCFDSIAHLVEIKLIDSSLRYGYHVSALATIYFYYLYLFILLNRWTILKTKA